MADTNATDLSTLRINCLRLWNSLMELAQISAISNGCGGIEERMAVVWDESVNTGRLMPSEFTAVTSANAAKLRAEVLALTAVKR